MGVGGWGGVATGGCVAKTSWPEPFGVGCDLPVEPQGHGGSPGPVTEGLVGRRPAPPPPQEYGARCLLTPRVLAAPEGRVEAPSARATLSGTQAGKAPVIPPVTPPARLSPRSRVCLFD